MASMTESAPQTTMQVPITEVDHLTAWKIRLMRIEDDVFNQADERNDDSWKGARKYTLKQAIHETQELIFYRIRSKQVASQGFERLYCLQPHTRLRPGQGHRP